MPVAWASDVVVPMANAPPAATPSFAAEIVTVTLVELASGRDLTVIVFVLTIRSSPSPPEMPVALAVAFVDPSVTPMPTAAPMPLTPCAVTPTTPLVATGVDVTVRLPVLRIRSSPAPPSMPTAVDAAVVSAEA